MCTSDCGIHRNGPIDDAGLLGGSQQPTQHDIPRAVSTHPSMPSPDRLPRPEHLGHISPGDTAPVPVDDSFDDLASVPKMSALLARSRGQELFNRRPLGIGEQLKP
jgi:hypothetical protein